MKTSKTILQALAILLLLGFSPELSHGQIYLTGLLQDGTSANGETAGSPIWNTLGNELSFANLYITQPNAGYTAPFINHGNGAGASISFALTPGSYQFYFFCDAFPDNNPGYYGLSLFFDGNNNTSPGIAAYSAAGVSSANAVPVGFGTLPLSVNTNYPSPAPGILIYTATPVPAPGTLTYTADGLTVTLTAYGFGMPGSFGVPALDRVSNLNDSPDGQPDGIGVFTLTVAPVPEPSTVAIACVAVLFLVVVRFRRCAGCTTFSLLPLQNRLANMKTTIPILIGTVILCGCATDKNPLMTGNPKDWRGHPTADLIAACGQPAHIFNQSDGEIWQYVNERDSTVPKGSHMAFNMQGFNNGGSGASGAAGGFESHDQYTAHFKRTDDFEIKDGIVKRWYGEIDQNGQIIWKGH